MKDPRSYAGCFTWRPSGRCLFLVLLAVAIAAVCLGQQEEAGRRRRTPRGAQFKTIQFPAPVTDSPVSFEKALTAQQEIGREVVDPPSNQRLKSADIGQLAWAAQGVAVPEAAGTTGQDIQFPIRVYFSLPEGFYQYHPMRHALEQTNDRDVRQDIAVSLLNRPDAPVGGCQIIISGSIRDFTTLYGTRAKTVMLLKVGQMAQSIQLQAIGLGLTFVSIDNVSGASIRRMTRLPRSQEAMYAVFVGYPASEAPESIGEPSVANGGKSVVIIAARQGFRDEELLQTKRALETASIQTLVASTRLGPISGELGTIAQASLLLNQVDLNNFDGVVFVGGTGAIDYFANRSALNLARQAAQQGKVLAASGIAPSILANAGVLRGVRVTAFLSERNRLIQAGANYTGAPVEKDHLIVTTTGPLALPTFAKAIIEALGEGR